MAMTLSSGTLLRDYRIQSLIGNGGMGEVYLAEEVTLERKVAIKVLRQDATANQHFVDRFRNEARVLAHLNHPSIVGLYSFFAEGDTYYLVMQYAPGITLAELIRRTGPIPEDRAMRIFTQIGEALQYAHGQGVVHRDIKPSNIMVDTEREDRALVMDFGIARLVADQHLTRSGIQVGTPCYMSPEQVLGEKEITGRTDIYSAGVVLYEMLSGSMPYDLNTESLYNVQSRIVHEPLPDPRRFYEFISENKVRLIEALTNKDPVARPDNILVLAKERISNPDAEYVQPIVQFPESQSSTLTPVDSIRQNSIPENRVNQAPDPVIQIQSNVQKKHNQLGGKLRWVAVGVMIFCLTLYGILILANSNSKEVIEEPVVDDSALAIKEPEPQSIQEDKHTEPLVEGITQEPVARHDDAPFEAYKANSQALMEDTYHYTQDLVQFWKTPESQGGAGQDIGNITTANISRWLGLGVAPYQYYSENGTIWFTPPVSTGPTSCYCVISGIGNVVRNGKVIRQDATVYIPECNASITPSEVRPMN